MPARKGTVSDGARRWHKEHPGAVGDREFSDDDLNTPAGRGQAAYASRIGNASARAALARRRSGEDRYRSGPNPHAVNVTIGGDSAA